MSYSSDTYHRQSIRLKDYDYAQTGAYFVTVCSYNRECVFGEFADGHIRLSALGLVVEECWRDLPNHHPGIGLDAFVVMPNHVHAIIVLNNVVPAEPAGPARAQQAAPLPHLRRNVPHGSLGAIVRSFKSTVTKRTRTDGRRGITESPVWQRNYYEHIIRSQDELKRIRQYILDNPAQWALDQENPAVGAGRAQQAGMAQQAAPLQYLARLLRQEEEAGFRDSTVAGGLDRLLRRWPGHLKPLLGEFTTYKELTPAQRKRWSDAVLARIEDSTPPSVVAQEGSPARANAAKLVPATARHQPARKQAPALILLDDDLARLHGIRGQTISSFKRLGVEKVRDLLFHFPHRHNDFANIRTVSQLEPGPDQTVVVNVWEASLTGKGPRNKSTQAILGDDTGNVRAIWFNQPYMARTLRPGAQVVISGRLNVFRGQLVFESPDYEVLQGQEELVHTGRLVPVYPSTEGLPQRTLRRAVKQALDLCVLQVTDFLPQEIRHRAALMGLQSAIAQAHYPDTPGDFTAARRRLAFDELFLLQLAVMGRKRKWQKEGRGTPLRAAGSAPLDAFLGSLPFSLTSAQARVLQEVLEDLQRDMPMSRLIQGDVGSGKTVVALSALLLAAFNGYQGAFMVPTEILAEQHFLTVSRLLAPLSSAERGEYLVTVRASPFPSPITVGLLLGSLSRQAKDEVHGGIADGRISIIIGTHALLQEPVEIPKLALVVVDEQHRFGVMQRASLRGKGRTPHLLAMSATPIPRSLALTMYGDLDMSTIDELPPGRLPVRTRWVEPGKREAAYGFLRKEVQAGRQGFVICPLVEESEVIESRAAIEEYQKLSTQVFPDLHLGLLHGRMSLREKEQVMDQFQKGSLDILVSTPVVEVGIDVPNATVMLIDGADRFGLAQLHQFRGRVGRGGHQSYCLVLADSPGEEARERLRLVERIHDGFELAEEDLRLRGPGDYLGTRQSGLPSLQMARITDQDILALARREAIKLLDSDPSFAREENALLAQRFKAYSAAITGEMS